MDPNDRRAIDELFANLDETARRAGPPEPEADDLIHRRLRENPSAAYHLAQTVVAQRTALERAQDRIDELEGRPGFSRRQAAGAPPREEGGFLSRMFGGGDRSRTAVPATHAPDPRGRPGYDPRYDRGMGRPGFGGGGFLAGAAQTAMGVAGGVLLGNMIMNAFDGNEAQAQTLTDGAGSQDQLNENDFGGGDDMGDVGDFGGDW